MDETSHETEKYEILFKALGGKSKLPEPVLSVPEKHKIAAKRILDKAGLNMEEVLPLLSGGHPTGFHQGLVPGTLCGNHLLDGKGISAPLFGCGSSI